MKHRLKLFAIGWMGCCLIVFILAITNCINPEPEIPQYDAAWRGVVYQTDMVSRNGHVIFN